MKRQIKIMGPKGHETLEWTEGEVSDDRIREIEREWTRLQKSEGFIAADVTVKGEERILGAGEGFSAEKDYVMIPRIMGGTGRG